MYNLSKIMKIQNFELLIGSTRHLVNKDIDENLYEYDAEFDSLTNVFYDLSNVFYERGIIMTLNIQGLRQDTHQCELSILLESFKDLIIFATNSESKVYELDFYEQGARYLLSFNKIDAESYSLNFNNRDVEGFELIQTKGSILELQLMLFSFFSQIVFFTDTICPAIANTVMYKDWKNQVGDNVPRW
jgi:hypothetical protein